MVLLSLNLHAYLFPPNSLPLYFSEAYFAPLRKYQRGRGVRTGLWVFGMISRDTGLFFGSVVPNRTQDTLENIIYSRVEPGCTIMSDEFSSYNRLTEHYQHFTCNHSEASYGVTEAGVSIHTNKIEGTWSILKTKVRQLRGARGRRRWLEIFIAARSWRCKGLSIFDYLVTS